MPSSHVSSDRLGEVAQTGSLAGLREAERRHVEGCQKCRSLFSGYRMADRLLAASWRQTTLPASILVRESARRRVANLPWGFASGFEFRRFAPAALAILLVAAIGLAFELPQLIPATRPSTSPSPTATRSASQSPSATEGQASPQPSASASAPDNGPSVSPAEEQSSGVGGATPQPKATVAPTPGSTDTPGPIVPAGVSSLSGWPIAWAPDGGHMLLAQVSAGPQGGSRIQIRDAAGRVTGSANGTAAVWVDSTTVAVASPSAGLGSRFAAGSTIALVDVTGHQIGALPGQYATPDTTEGLDGGVLVGSGSGELAVVGQSGANFYGATYVTRNGHSVGASRQGVPIAFSQDGGKLAVIHPTYGPGGSLGNLTGSLEIVSSSGSKTLASFPRLHLAASSGVPPDYPNVAFSPNGASLLVSGTLVDLATGLTTDVGNGGWLPDGTLTTVSNGQVMRWSGTHPTADSRFAGGGVVETSSRGDVVEYFADGRPPLATPLPATLLALTPTQLADGTAAPVLTSARTSLFQAWMAFWTARMDAHKALAALEDLLPKPTPTPAVTPTETPI